MTARLGAIADRLLPAWFLAWSLARIQSLGWVGNGWDLSFVGRDFRIYRAAGEAVLGGGDPWAASATWNGTAWHYAAPPTAAQLFAPVALVPEPIGLVLFLALSLVVVAVGLRRLGLPLWWLLFPPLSEGLIAGNPQILLLGLLLVGGPAARAVAVGLKSYAIAVPIARREWRAVAVSGVLLVVSLAAGAGLWLRYVADAGSISARLVQESGGGVSAALVLRPGVFGTLLPDGPLAVAAPWLIVLVAALLVVVVAARDVTAAGWLVVPLLLPAAEYHLATLAIPIARRWSTWLIAIPSVPTYLVGLLVLGWEVAAARPSLAVEPAPTPLPAWLAGLPIPGLASRLDRVDRPIGRIDGDRRAA